MKGFVGCLLLALGLSTAASADGLPEWSIWKNPRDSLLVISLVDTVAGTFSGTFINNAKGCGITLAAHNMAAIHMSGPDAGQPDPAGGGVYNETVEGNTSDNNGATGVGIFNAAYNNTIQGNTFQDTVQGGYLDVEHNANTASDRGRVYFSGTFADNTGVWSAPFLAARTAAGNTSPPTLPRNPPGTGPGIRPAGAPNSDA